MTRISNLKHALSNKMSLGYIYILGNNSYQNNLLKIGRTSRSPDDRMQELMRATGVPGNFQLLYAEYTQDCNTAESIVHQTLIGSNHSEEFFLVELEDAIKTVQSSCKQVRNVKLEPSLEAPMISHYPRLSNDRKTTWISIRRDLEAERALCRYLMPQYMKECVDKFYSDKVSAINSSGKKSFIQSWFEHFGLFISEFDDQDELFIPFSLRTIQLAFQWINVHFYELDLGGNYAWFSCAKKVADLIHNKEWSTRSELTLISDYIKKTRWYES